VISFHLQDDSLSIHEPPQRNLGIVTGKFLEKSVHLNQLTGMLFKPEDLIPGNTIKVYNNEFIIMDMDEYTQKTMADPNANGRKFDLESVVQKLRESMRQQFPLVRDIFRRFDGDHDGVVTLPEFRKALLKFGYVLQAEEEVQLMRHFDVRGDGQISYNEFCDALLDEDYTTEMLKTKPALKGGYDQDYQMRALNKIAERTETADVRKAVRQIGDILYKRQGMSTKIFKELGHLTHEDTVTCEQIQYALKQCGNTVELDDVVRTVLFVLPDCDLQKVPYVELFKALVASFHDTFASR
jgi:Ca2+-binding EF-hand superfamily protein